MLKLNQIKYPLQAINPYFVKYKSSFIWGIIFIILANFFAILMPLIAGFIVSCLSNESFINLADSKLGIVNKTLIFFLKHFHFELKAFLISCSALLVFITLLRGLFLFFMRQTMIGMSRNIEYNIRNEIYNKYLCLDQDFYKKNKTGDLMNRITEDLNQVRNYLGPAVMYIINLFFTIIFCLYNMFTTNFKLSLYVLIPLGLLSCIIYFINQLINKKALTLQNQLSNLTSIAQESFNGIKTIKSFGLEETVINKFIRTNMAYQKNSFNIKKIDALYTPSIQFFVSLSILVTLGFSSLAALENDKNWAATIIEFIFYLNLLSFPFSALGLTASMIQKASASQQRINEFMSIKPTISLVDEFIKTRFSPPIHIQFNKVNFTYPKQILPALQDINIEINDKEKILILGKIGSGKTSFLNLILRMNDPEKGTIKINQLPLNKIDYKNWRKSISFVPQESFLFNKTIEDNLTVGLESKPSLEEMIEVCRLSQIDEEIRSLPQQYQTVIGEKGANLSGGQKQRLCLARALLKKSNLLLFDDCLSAVDYMIENKITFHLSQFLETKTAIFVANKIYKNIHFDKIICLHNGKIVESGTIEKLLKNKGFFYHLNLIN